MKLIKILFVCFCVTAISGITAVQSQIRSETRMEYYNLGGTVFSDEFPAESFYATLIYNYSDIYIYVSKTFFDTLGYYYFMNLPNGNYMVKAEPIAPGSYVPTYFGNTLHWQESSMISLFSDQYNSDVQLIAAPGYDPGPGTISGTLDLTRKSSGGKEGMPDIEVLLLSTSGDPLTYRITDDAGQFFFADIAYGTYLVYPEMHGKITTPFLVTLDANHPSLDIWFSIDEHSIYAGIDEPGETQDFYFSGIYPVPADDHAFLDYTLPQECDALIEIFDLTGRMVCSIPQAGLQAGGTLSVDLCGMEAGTYFVRISAGDMPVVTRRFLIQR
jgi:hypothetical protein